MISLAEPKRIWKAASSATVTSKCANEPTPDQEAGLVCSSCTCSAEGYGISTRISALRKQSLC
ncbi:uncharacterized protein [Physcomitrium patens]|uniref:uncharacterized protein isoform X5 n=1 Tax=Physcomitrium patens TaxID=3218 RepID=UPI003CCDB339